MCQLALKRKTLATRARPCHQKPPDYAFSVTHRQSKQAALPPTKASNASCKIIKPLTSRCMHGGVRSHEIMFSFILTYLQKLLGLLPVSQACSCRQHAHAFWGGPGAISLQVHNMELLAHLLAMRMSHSKLLHACSLAAMARYQRPLLTLTTHPNMLYG